MIKSIVSGVDVTSDPKRQECGAPDYIIMKKQIPVGFIEAKDVGISLDQIEKSDQLTRYRASLDNLILTDYVEFRFYRNGKHVSTAKIGTIKKNRIVAEEEQWTKILTLIQEFCAYQGQTIKSAEKLAVMMANKAKLMRVILHNALKQDNQDNSLREQYAAFKRILIHDLTEEDFADIYAQTIAYGLFSARLHDTTLEDFSRQEAIFLVPKTNPFLRQLFSYITGPDLDERIVWIVDELANVFQACNIKEILRNFGLYTQKIDPMIHFYATFLKEYNPKLRKKRGVYYTPQPIVNFIIKSVDKTIIKEFKLSDGLADIKKTKVEIDNNGQKELKTYPQVQILDPAVGTGTFLSEVIKYILNRFKDQEGIWSAYVENELLDRLYGFEILIAPYAMCHLKLELLLNTTNYKPKAHKRLHVYLTNSLEEPQIDNETAFASWLSHEASEANEIKKQAPIMVIIGNPPYSVSSVNKGIWITNLLKDYKQGLKEKKLNLDDDYIKFIRFAEYYISKNQYGIIGMITNNTYLDGITHRQMRKHLLDTFDKIYIYDLHGNVKKNEKTPDGGKDENVFDIQQGVAISLMLKKMNSQKKLAQVFYQDIYGKRNDKYQKLWKSDVSTVQWKKIKPIEPFYFFVERSSAQSIDGSKYFNVTDLFKTYGNGIGTDRDHLFYSQQRDELKKRIKTLYLKNELTTAFIEEYNIRNSSSYNLLNRLEKSEFDEKFIHKCLYRPFDVRYLYYNPKLTSRPAHKIMKHLYENNIALLVTRQLSTEQFKHTFITSMIVDRDPLSVATRERTQVFPIYIQLEDINENRDLISLDRVPNFRMDVINKLSKITGLNFSQEKECTIDKYAPIDILDYIYAILHSPTYRIKLNDTLKSDFPKIPYPSDGETFWKVVKIGETLRKLHLLKQTDKTKITTKFPKEGSNIVEKVKFIQKNNTGQIWINNKQYFECVPLTAWEFFIGNYQPAQKWLKDRVGIELKYEDIIHYQRIIYILNETDEITRKSDELVKQLL